jgi:1,4-dihydroxy-2-naphthoyl-CoA synthase
MQPIPSNAAVELGAEEESFSSSGERAMPSVQRVGTLRANHLLYERERFEAARAAELGIVGKVVAHDDLRAETDALLDRVRRTGPRARSAMKTEMRRALPEVDTAGPVLDG